MDLMENMEGISVSRVLISKTKAQDKNLEKIGLGISPKVACHFSLPVKLFEN